MTDRTSLPDVDLDSSTALIVVDVQNDFADPKGNLYVADGDRTIPLINDLTAAARRSGSLVVYTQDWHPEQTPHFQPYGGTWPIHCVQGTWGAELHRDLHVEGDVIRKGVNGEDGYSGFAAHNVETGEEISTGLRELLDEREIRRVVIVGLAEDVCVKETALDARRLGYATQVLLAATRPVNVEETDASTAQAAMRAAGVELR